MALSRHALAGAAPSACPAVTRPGAPPVRGARWAARPGTVPGDDCPYGQVLAWTGARCCLLSANVCSYSPRMFTRTCRQAHARRIRASALLVDAACRRAAVIGLRVNDRPASPAAISRVRLSGQTGIQWPQRLATGHRGHKPPWHFIRVPSSRRHGWSSAGLGRLDSKYLNNHTTSCQGLLSAQTTLRRQLL